MAHSIIAPSAAGIWGKPGGCTGYVGMAQMYPETEENEAAKEGTASHEVGAQMVSALARARVGYPRADAMIGSVASNGVVITDEMYDAAELYADDVAEVMHETRVYGGPNLRVEEGVHAKAVHELSYGTPDCSILDSRNGHLYIWDYKFGRVPVEVFENWQLINYFAGLLDEIGLGGGLQDEHLTVHFRVVQPRVYHRDGPVREWVVKASDLRGHVNILRNNAEEALGPNAVCRSGSHCWKCPARHACDTALRAGVTLFEAANAPTPVDMSTHALAVQYGIIQRARKQLEYLESGYDEQIQALLGSGQQVPGYRAEEAIGRETWQCPPEEVFSLGELLGIELRQNRPVTPKQAVKLGIDESVIKAYSHKPRTGVKVVPDNGSKAKKVFSK